MSRKRMSLILAIVCFTVTILAIGGITQIVRAEEPMKVIGKITIPAGTKIISIIQIRNSLRKIVLIAFDEQSLYIIERIKATVDSSGNSVEAGYLVDIDGFRHACPVHGLEIMRSGLTGIADSRIKAEGFKIEIF